MTKQKATTSTYQNQNTTDEEEGYPHNNGFCAGVAGQINISQLQSHAVVRAGQTTLGFNS